MKKIYLSIFLIFLCVLPSSSQVLGESKIYSLDDCLKIALKNNYNIVVGQSRMKAAKANSMNAFGGYLPGINLRSSFNRRLGEQQYISRTKYDPVSGQPLGQYSDPQSMNQYSITGSIDWILFDGFARENNFQVAKNQEKKSKIEHKQTIVKVRYNIKKKYIDVIKNLQIVKTRQENFELGKKELDRIKAQYEAGEIPIGSVYSQEAELGSRELAIVNAEMLLDNSKNQLLSEMGLDPVTNAEFLENSLPSEISDSEIKNYAASNRFIMVVKGAMSNRKDLEASNISIEIAKSNVKSSYAGYIPTLRSSYNWNWNNSKLSNFDKGTSSIGLNLSIPIFDKFQTNRLVENAKLQVEESNLQKVLLEQQIRSNVQSAYLTLKSTEKGLDITKRSIKSAERNMESAKERFYVGEASITDLHTANTQYITTKINLINAVYDYIKAQNEINFAIGK